ncbi:MAG: hypothetical protein WC584_02065 [Candidatus Pacearchaeota archaeon]
MVKNKMGNKRGQFYLLAAIVIIVLIIGYAGVSNYLKKKNTTRIYDVKEELNIEGKDVLEFGILKSEEISLKINGVTQQISGEEAIIKHFITLYTTYLESIGESMNIYYVFGNPTEIKAYELVDVETGSFILTIDGATPITNNIIRKSIQELKESGSYTTENGKVKVKIGENNYEFELKSGENFYFIISQKVGGEQYVETN